MKREGARINCGTVIFIQKRVVHKILIDIKKSMLNYTKWNKILLIRLCVGDLGIEIGQRKSQMV